MPSTSQTLPPGWRLEVTPPRVGQDRCSLRLIGPLGREAAWYAPAGTICGDVLAELAADIDLAAGRGPETPI